VSTALITPLSIFANSNAASYAYVNTTYCLPVRLGPGACIIKLISAVIYGFQ
jgi:hypothetical protein